MRCRNLLASEQQLSTTPTLAEDCRDVRAVAAGISLPIGL